MVGHDAVGQHPAAGEVLIHPHEGAEFLLFNRSEHEIPADHAGDAVVDRGTFGGILPGGKPACASHGNWMVYDSGGGVKKSLVDGDHGTGPVALTPAPTRKIAKSQGTVEKISSVTQFCVCHPILLSHLSIRHRRRNRLARGADPIHAAGTAVPIPALPAAAEWGAGDLEQHRGGPGQPAGAVGGAANAVERRIGIVKYSA